jgi:hypothetical protein
MARSRAPAVILAVDGPSAAGKSTIVARAARDLGWVPLAEAYDRLDPPVDLRFADDRGLASIERALLEEESRRWRSAHSLRRQGWTVVVDTDFLGPLTYTSGLVALGRASPAVLRSVLRRARELARRGLWGLPDGLVYLTTGSSVRRERVARDPSRHPPDLALRHELVGEVEERFYRGSLPAAFPGRVKWLVGERPLERLVGELRRFAGTVRPLPARDRSITSVVNLLEKSMRSAPAVGGRRASATVKKPASSPRAPRG